jgi:predicted negative regulator of RcsB-dependent stress response
MPKLIKRRVSKKTGDTETEVQERLSSLKDTLMERQKTVWKFGAGIVIIIAVVVGLLVYSSTSQKKAGLLESEGYKIYYGNPQVQAVNKDEQYKKALGLFKKAYDTKNTPFSLFYVAACYYELGKYDDALKTLKDFTQRYPNNETFSPLVYQKMALTYTKKGDIKEAEKTLDALYGLKGDIFKDFALMEYGRLLEKEGKPEEAKKKYEELAKKFPNSPFKDEVKAKLAAKKEG